MVVENFISISPYTQASTPQKFEFSFAFGYQVLDCPDFSSNNLLVLGFDVVAGCTVG